MEYFGYRKLLVYQKAKELVKLAYETISFFPNNENFALCSQIRRSAVSITSNIAEGVSRYSAKEKIHFIEMSYGSLMEMLSQFEIAVELQYIPIAKLNEIEQLSVEVINLLTKLQYSYLPKNEDGTIDKPYDKNNKPNKPNKPL